MVGAVWLCCKYSTRMAAASRMQMSAKKAIRIFFLIELLFFICIAQLSYFDHYL